MGVPLHLRHRINVILRVRLLRLIGMFDRGDCVQMVVDLGVAVSFARHTIDMVHLLHHWAGLRLRCEELMKFHVVSTCFAL